MNRSLVERYAFKLCLHALDARGPTAYFVAAELEEFSVIDKE